MPIEVQDADARMLHTAIHRFLAQAVQHALDCGNQGDSDWRVYGVRSDGRRFAVVYDNPVRAWLLTGDSKDVVSKEVDWGLIDHDSATDEVVAIQVWSASERLPASVVEALPTPSTAHGAAA